MATATVELELDVPEEVSILGCERHGDSFSFEVDWPWPERCACDQCGHEQPAQFERKNKFRVIRDLDVWGQPSFWTYQVVFHRCHHCGHRQELIPPFRRRQANHTYRFEEMVIRMAIGSTVEDVARRLAISAEKVEHILETWADEERKIGPKRKITDIGMDEISLKNGHKMYVTILTDLTDPNNPQILAVMTPPSTARKRTDASKTSANVAKTKTTKIWTSALSGPPTTTGKTASWPTSTIARPAALSKECESI